MDIISKIKKKDGKFNSKEVDYVLRVLENSKKKDINFVKKLEDEFCKLYDYKYAIACNSGTSGLHSALYALDFLLKDFGFPNLFGLAFAYIGFFVAITSSYDTRLSCHDVWLLS